MPNLVSANGKRERRGTWKQQRAGGSGGAAPPFLRSRASEPDGQGSPFPPALRTLVHPGQRGHRPLLTPAAACREVPGSCPPSPPPLPGAPSLGSRGSVLQTPPALQETQRWGRRTWWRGELLGRQAQEDRGPPLTARRPPPLSPLSFLALIRSCDGSSCCQMQRLLPQKVTSGHLF